MWWKWSPWRFLVRNVARRKDFLDPVKIILQLQNFARSSEVAAPIGLIRSGVVLHARGLVPPYYDSWFLDVGSIPEEREALILSHHLNVSQKLVIDSNFAVITELNFESLKHRLKSQVIGFAHASVCQIKIAGSAFVKAQFVVSHRPFVELKNR